jgi:catechol 2,3-dioxygenase-like lactoylglutathione lyase family enzyme
MLGSIDHINIVVADLEKMIGFYTSLLGLKVTKRGRLDRGSS